MDKTTKRYLIGGAAVAVIAGGTFAFLKIRKRAKIKKDINSYSKGTTPDGTININGVVESLGLDLGYAYPSWDPRSWTENDSAVIETVKTIPKKYITQVEVAFFKKYQKNLREVLKKLTDFSQIAYLWQ